MPSEHSYSVEAEQTQVTVYEEPGSKELRVLIVTKNPGEENGQLNLNEQQWHELMALLQHVHEATIQHE